MMYYRTITLDLFTYLLFKFTFMWSIHVSCCRRDIRAEIERTGTSAYCTRIK